MTKHRLHVEDDDEDTVTQSHTTTGHWKIAELLNNSLVDSCTYDKASHRKKLFITVEINLQMKTDLVL